MKRAQFVRKTKVQNEAYAAAAYFTWKSPWWPLDDGTLCFRLTAGVSVGAARYIASGDDATTRTGADAWRHDVLGVSAI